MFHLLPRGVLLSVFLVPWTAAAQGSASSLPDGRYRPADAADSRFRDLDLLLAGKADAQNTDPQKADDSASRLDLKASWKARREYERGYHLLLLDDLRGAAEHLTKAIAKYPKFVAAHNALGTAYLKLGEKEQAKSEFSRAIALDGKCLRSKCEQNHDLGYELLKRFAQIMNRRLDATRIQLLDLYATR